MHCSLLNEEYLSQNVESAEGRWGSLGVGGGSAARTLGFSAFECTFFTSSDAEGIIVDQARVCRRLAVHLTDHSGLFDNPGQGPDPQLRDLLKAH